MEQQTSYNFGKPEDGNAVLYLHGSLDHAHIGQLWNEILESLKEQDAPQLICDFEDVTFIDTAGMAMLRTIEEHYTAKGNRVTRRNLPRFEEHFLQYEKTRASREKVQEEAPRRSTRIERIGGIVSRKLFGLYLLIEFIGKLVSSTAYGLSHPHRMRYREFLLQFQKVGAEAVPLVFGLSGLMGLVIVFMGLPATRQFGSNIYIANMVALSVTGQMAPILTAIIVSGRTGAAFAAEIGTMQVRHEIDVLSVMNFDIASFIVLPRVLAVTLATPILTVIADAAGILGGFLTARIVLGLPAEAFFHQVRITLGASNIYTGVIKGAGFGFLVGITGCFYGLQTGETADSVGDQTTSAVVSGILLVIVADAIFAYLFNMNM